MSHKLRGRCRACGQLPIGPPGKLDGKAVHAILNSSEPGTVLAARYGVSKSRIYQIRPGRHSKGKGLVYNTLSKSHIVVHKGVIFAANQTKPLSVTTADAIARANGCAYAEVFIKRFAPVYEAHYLLRLDYLLRVVSGAEDGAAHLDVRLKGGMLHVKHGDTGETLIVRAVVKGYWSGNPWPS